MRHIIALFIAILLIAFVSGLIAVLPALEPEGFGVRQEWSQWTIYRTGCDVDTCAGVLKKGRLVYGKSSLDGRTITVCVVDGWFDEKPPELFAVDAENLQRPR